MIKKPGMKSKEGLQVSGIYLLLIVGAVKYLFPDVEPEDIMEVVEWWQSQDIGPRQIIDYIWDGTVLTYIAGRLRKKNGGNNDNPPA